MSVLQAHGDNRLYFILNLFLLLLFYAFFFRRTKRHGLKYTRILRICYSFLVLTLTTVLRLGPQSLYDARY